MSDRPLKVVLDARCLNVTHVRGIGKAVIELITRTARSGAIEWHLLSDRPDLPMQAPKLPGCYTELFSTPGYRFHSWEQWSLPRRAQQLGADLVYAPAISAPRWQPVPTIVNILDTIPWQNNDAFWPAGWYRDSLLPSVYHRSAAVLTISDTSRRDILTRWPDLQPKLHVVTLGVDERYLDADWCRRPRAIDGLTIREPYLLYIGGAEPRKRVAWAIKTWLGLGSQDVTLVCCGLEPVAHEQLRALIPADRQHQFVTAPYISEHDLPQLYMGARAVLYPTLYEGFGLPALEAQAVGTPVLFSDVGSLRELTGPGAVVLPVDDLQAWVGAVESILAVPSDAVQPNLTARAWARQYSWEQCVERTLSIYHTVAGVLNRRRH